MRGMNSHQDMDKYTGLVIFAIFGMITLITALFCVCRNLMNQQSNLAQVGINSSSTFTGNNKIRNDGVVSSDAV